ncbi:MAG: acyl-CoA thioesterase [Synergistaceae bacterium]|nr:acyl-CoA thioesterase [Synergistaceae bacterium]
MEKEEGIRHTCRTRVRYGETDKMGIAYYGRYVDWFEMGRTEFCRASGKSYTEWEAEGILLPVVEAHCRYKSSLFYDDEIEIETRVTDLTRVSVTFACRVFRVADGKLAAEGYTRHAFTGPDGKLLKRGNALEAWLGARTQDSQEG